MSELLYRCPDCDSPVPVAGLCQDCLESTRAEGVQMTCGEIRRALAGDPADDRGFLCLADAIEGVRQLRAGFVSPDDRRLLVRYLESEELRCANQRDQKSPWLVELRRIMKQLAQVAANEMSEDEYWKASPLTKAEMKMKKKDFVPTRGNVEFVHQAEAEAVARGDLPPDEATVRVTLPAPPTKALIDAMTVLGWREPAPCDGVGDPIVRHGMPAGPALVAGGQGRTGEETGRRCGWWCGLAIAAAVWMAIAAVAKWWGWL